MGTLRIKRGTKTQLQTSPGYTPAEGELVYTTDSKEVFVGDGSTQGGIPVSVSTQNLEDLGNVQALAAQKDQILVYNGTNWAATNNPALDLRGNIYGDDSTLLVDAINGEIVGPINTTSIISSGNITGDLIGDVTGSVTGNLVGDSAGTHFGNVNGAVIGDLTGSVFADDSKLVVDGLTGDLYTSNLFSPTLTLRSSIPTSLTEFTIDSTDNTNNLKFIRSSASDISSDADQYGRITFGRSDTGGEVNTVSISGFQDGLAISHDTNGTHLSGGLNLYIKDGVFGFGTYTPDVTAKVHVEGKLNVTGNSVLAGAVQMDSTLRLGQFTTAERDALTPANGMLIYNTSTNKLQAYENGAWVNFI